MAPNERERLQWAEQWGGLSVINVEAAAMGTQPRRSATVREIYRAGPAGYDEMMRRIIPTLVHTLVVPMCVLVLSLATSAMAQAPVPKDKQAPDDNSWKTPAAAVLFAGFVIAVSIKQSKREHRD